MKINNRMSISQTVVWSLFLAASPVAGYAQTGLLEEVIVTAQKREQSIQDVPVSISVASGLELDALKIFNVNDIAALVPNLQVNQILGDATPVFSLRGVTMNDFSIHQSSPIAVYTDEVYAGAAAMQPMAMFDLARVEVLRGPQGTLYGRNSTGGAVNLVTRAPGFETEGYVSAGVGNFNRREFRAAAQTGLIDDALAIRVAATGIEQDGFFTNPSPGVGDHNSFDEWAFRVAALWQPTDRLDFTLRYSSGRATPTSTAVLPANVDEIGVGLGADIYDLYNALGGASLPDYNPGELSDFELESNYNDKKRRRTEQVSLHMNWALSEALTLTSVSAWSDANFFNPEDSDGSPMTVIHNDYSGDGDQVSQDLRLTSDFGGTFEFVAGVYFARERLAIKTDLDLYTDIDFNLSGDVEFGDCLDPWNAALGEPLSEAGVVANEVLLELGFPNGMADLAALGCGYRNSFEQERSTSAVYFDGSVEILPDTSLLFGVRYTDDETEVDNYRTAVEGDGVFLFDTVPSADDALNNSEVTWRVGLERRFSDDTLGFLTFSRGYREGAFNGQGFFSPEEFNHVEPETIDAFELGLKTLLADGRLRLNTSVFYYQYKGQQLLDSNPESGATTLNNLDESRVFGLEAEVQYQANDDLILDLGLGWLDAEAREGTINGLDQRGERLPTAPDWNINSAVTWDLIQTSAGSLSMRVDALYVGAQYFTLPHVKRLEADAYTVANVRFGFSSADGHWEVGGWVRNVADESYITSTVALDGLAGYDYSQIGPPRHYGVDFTYNF